MFQHVTVLKKEAIEGLKIRPDGIYVDCTLGGAGHSLDIASRLSEKGRLIGIDQDDKALEAAGKRLEAYRDRVILVKSNFSHLQKIVQEQGFQQVDGVLFDLGVSSPQFDEGERGFSYQHDAPLDMRMDREQTLNARVIVNEWSEQEIANVIYQFGEEKFSRRIAKEIVKEREKQPIETTEQLVELIKRGIPAPARRTGPHPARRTFQGLRIAVNRELDVFEEALHQAIAVAAVGGRVSVISFHSLEDRLCKKIFRKYSQGCICPPGLPACACGNKPTIKEIKRKPILPSQEEMEENPRARSAKLRVAEKL